MEESQTCRMEIFVEKLKWCEVAIRSITWLRKSTEL